MTLIIRENLKHPDSTQKLLVHVKKCIVRIEQYVAFHINMQRIKVNFEWFKLVPLLIDFFVILILSIAFTGGQEMTDTQTREIIAIRVNWNPDL